jgi:protein SCO1/2
MITRFSFALLAVAAIAGLILIIGMDPGTPDNQPADTIQTGVAGSGVGGPFELTNQDGATVTDQDFAGKIKLIYFGFTYCPDICPLGLKHMTAGYDQLPQSMRRHIQPIFITIDPDRDTPDVLKNYVDLFHDDLIGLTGTEAQIADVADHYKVYYAKDERTADDPDHYLMNHSSQIFIMGPDGRLLDLYRHKDRPDTIADGLRRAVKTSGI